MAHQHDCETCAASEIKHAPPITPELIEKVKALLGDRAFVVVTARKDATGMDLAEAITNMRHQGFIARTLLRGAFLYAPRLAARVLQVHEAEQLTRVACESERN